MTTGREVTPEQVTDDYILNTWYKPAFKEHILNKYSGAELEQILENNRQSIVKRSQTPQVILDLLAHTDDFHFDVTIFQEHLSETHDVIKPRIENAQAYQGKELTGKDRAFLVWMYEKFADRKQNELCAAAGITPRHYRDMRDIHEEEFDEMLSYDPIYESAASQARFIQGENDKALANFMHHLKLLGFQGVDEWGEHRPIDDKIDKALAAALKYSGPYHCDCDKWYNLKFLEWWITLSAAKQEQYTTKKGRKKEAHK
jgi:hypothetical protein